MKKLLQGFFLLCVLFFFCFSGTLFFYSKTRGGKEDLKRLKEHIKLHLFRHGFIDSLNQKETFHLYEKKCYRQCHGEATMITAVLPPAGWMQVVERMRLQEGVEMTGREAEAIIRYLELKFPAHRSSIPYEVRRKINRLLWKNDVGYGDLYLDVIYATQVYFDSINARHLIKNYKLQENIVFLISMTVHEGRVKHYPVGKLAFLRINGKEYKPLEPWELRFETADGHHIEGVLKFPKKYFQGENTIGPQAGKMELILKNLESSRDRIFAWDLPILYPEEYENLPKT